MLLFLTFLCYLTSILSHETTLESNLKWFFDKMENDSSFRNYLIGSSEMDELSQSLNYLGNPLTDWLVLLDPENWPEPEYFGVMLVSQKTCQSQSGFGIEKHVVFPKNPKLASTNSSSLGSDIFVQCLNVELKSFTPFRRLLVASDFDKNQILKKSNQQSEKSNNSSRCVVFIFRYRTEAIGC